MGCQMNEADSALISGQLARAGYGATKDPAEADVILLNTCAVREKAEDRVYGRSSQLSRHRATKPNLVIGITGCMAEHLREKLAETAPHVSLVAGPDSYRNIAELVDTALGGQRAVDVALDKSETYEGLDGVQAKDGVSAFVTIQRGCDKFCTFCVVPYTRGRERGVAPREVLRHCRDLAKLGYKEVTLLGQTVNSYAWEDVTFAELLRAVAQIEGIERIRFTSPYPVDFTDELIGVIAEEPKVCPYVHMPLQVGSDVVLQRMKRGYTKAEFLTLVGKLRKACPDIAISTDLMVGFCGETEEDHAETLEMMREIKFDFAFMFRYSDRDITYASRKLEDDIPLEIKKRRLQEVIELQESQTRASHEAKIGTEQDVLVIGESKRGDRMMGRTPAFFRTLLPLGSAKKGETVRVKVTGSTGHSLIAEPLS
jgi:tRNA-2-methylthio-N6-dimethylallyladenosine synthase